MMRGDQRRPGIADPKNGVGGKAHEDLEFDRYVATARALFFKASYRARF